MIQCEAGRERCAVDGVECECEAKPTRTTATDIARRCGGQIPTDILLLPWRCPENWTIAELRAEIERRIAALAPPPAAESD